MDQPRLTPAWVWVLTTTLILGLPGACRREASAPQGEGQEQTAIEGNPIERVSDPEVRELLLSEDPESRTNGLVMLEAPPDLALDVFEYIWDHDPHPTVRGFLVDEVAGRGGPGAGHLLVKIALEARDPYVRDSALYYLTLPEFLPVVSVEDLMTLVNRNDLHSDFRLDAVDLLQKMRTPEAIEALEKIASEHPDPVLRYTAVYEMRAIGDPAFIPFLEKQLEKEEDREVRAALKGAIEILSRPPEEEPPTAAPEEEPPAASPGEEPAPS